MTAVDAASVLLEGPWEHRFVAANAARFHVAEAGSGPLVVLLHGFPEMWWAWRHQIPALAAAGYRAAAIDLRGSGASDKPPQGYDLPTLTRDVAGVIRSLGASDAVVVGHGLGGTVAWSMPTLRPGVTRAVAALSSAHPARMHTSAAARPLLLHRTTRRLGFFQLPWFPERRLTHGDLAVRLLREWGAGGWPDAETAAVYRSAMRVPFAAHSSMETLRWLVRSTPRVDGQRYLAAVRTPIEVPVLQVHGALDPCLPPAAVGRAAHGRPFRFELVEGAGHYLPEEAPEAVTDLLLDWLASLD
ncbi:alpha/beta hydrolase [Actinotalea sp. M2MS4P-6]|uniref:alpha/beta fold hydrolase n=1 Tax=Actinotalea sp. M2MS4P-6 TaxID=2983762 RepID=UPI0021E437D4|nr:alpha/beta hydrolase [Actinotalea sp. M2MS4P-6]MCV2393186.1 alpha/beta hydrolase [Actinotalea sp. M2MS4P-6]